ncbi:hypothetical protein MCELHM10_04072 [Paracoccaceae bacterium]
MNIPNRITLDTLDQQPIGDIIALPAEDLVQLQAEVEERFRKAKQLRDWFNGSLIQKYEHRAQTERLAANKDSGTVRFQDGCVTVIADVPKRVEWDQAALAAMAERIRASGDNPTDYLEIAFSVPERRYSAWPPAMRDGFAGARTLRTGRPTFSLTLNAEDK